MSRPAPSPGGALTTAGFAAATTWVTLLSWRGFTDRPATFLVPLVVLAVVVAGVGGLGRAARIGTGGVLLLQTLLGGMVFGIVWMSCQAVMPAVRAA